MMKLCYEMVPASGSLCPLPSSGIDLQEASKVKEAGFVEDVEGAVILCQVMGSGAVMIVLSYFPQV